NTLSGGAVGRMAIFGLSVTPYLSAAGIVQVVSLTWPRMRALYERGDRGRRTIRRYTLVLTLLLALFQAWGVASALLCVVSLVAYPAPFFRFSTVITLTGGTFLLILLC